MNPLDSSALSEMAGRVVRRATGAVPNEIVKIPQGVMTWKFRVDVPSGEAFIVRFYPPGREEVVEYEPDLLRCSAAAGVSVPQVVVDSRSGPEAPLHYVMYRMIEGQALSDRWRSSPQAARERLVEELVDQIHRLSAIRVVGFGDLEEAKRGRYDSWNAFLQRSLEEGIEAAERHGTISGPLLSDAVIILEHLDSLQVPCTPGVLWGDMSPRNILVDENNQLVGLLDFEGALAGDVVLNLGYCFAEYCFSDFYGAILKAWPNRGSEELATTIELCAVVRGMRLVKHAHKGYLPAGEARTPVEDYLPGFVTAATNLRRRLGKGSTANRAPEEETRW